MSENDNHKSGFEFMRAKHEARHRRERELAAQGVDYIAESRRGAVGRLLESLPESAPLNRRKQAVFAARARSGEPLRRERLPELDLLLWDRSGELISPQDAYVVYLTRWPHLDESRLTMNEALTINALLEVFEGDPMVVFFRVYTPPPRFYRKTSQAE